jgi:hypothetical protein
VTKSKNKDNAIVGRERFELSLSDSRVSLTLLEDVEKLTTMSQGTINKKGEREKRIIYFLL